MTTTKVLDIQGLDALKAALKQAEKELTPALRKALSNSLHRLHDTVAEYPPASAANRPGREDRHGRQMGYYERGRGWWQPTSEKLSGPVGKKHGQIRAGKAHRQATGVTGYKLRNGGESELLGRSWATKVTEGRGSLSGELGTTVSYANLVQGDDQERYHKARGWITVAQALAQEQTAIYGEFERAIDKVMRSI